MTIEPTHTGARSQSRLGGIVLGLMLAGAAAAGGYIFGSRAPAASGPPLAKQAEPGGPVIYYRDPDGRNLWSAAPKKTADGRDFLPVRASEDVSFDPEQPRDKSGGERRILYYRHPMGLPDTSPTPKKDSMGMDYIPVHDGEDEGGGVRVSLDKVQRTGVRTEAAAMRVLSRAIRAPGIARPDERTLYSVVLRTDGFIEKLHVKETGRQVAHGEPLFRLYSPEMVRVQVDYRIAMSGGWRDEQGAQQRLKNLQVPPAVLDELRRTREPVIAFDWPAPVSGIVLRRQAIEGMMMRAGEEAMRLADLSRIWVIADISEQDLGVLRIGAKAIVRFRAFPETPYSGEVTFVLGELDPATRTAKARIELPNLDHRIRFEMFADVEITPEDSKERLSVPVSALIDSGARRIVLVERSEGRFEPRAVRTGVRTQDHVEIVEGIAEGEKVVTAATFLIDAESNLKAALSTFTTDAAMEAKP